MPSARLGLVLERLGLLRQTFVPRFDPTGVYTVEEQENAHAFLVFFHAEVESFIEARALEIAASALSIWQNQGKSSKALVALCAVHGGEGKDKRDENLDERIARAHNAFEDVVGKNNGVKRPNLRKMLSPIGIEFNVSHESWLVEMEQFGGRRGNSAHRSGARLGSGRNAINPADEWRRAQVVLVGLTDLDARFDAAVVT